MTETDKVAVITELRQKYKLTALLEVAELPRSTYYYYISKAKEPDKYAGSKKKSFRFITKIRGGMDIRE